MADTYIDQFETIAYGNFAVAQIQELVVGLEPAFDKALKLVVAKLTTATQGVEVALERAGSVHVATYKPKEGADDHVAAAQDVLRRAAKYAESRPGGDAIANAILGGETLTTILRRRPAKLLGSLTTALAAVAKHKSKLPEHKTWSEVITAARDALEDLDKKVRKTRTERRAMTPEVTAAREEWLKIYGAAKLLVEAVLRLHDKTALMPEVFDDLSEKPRATTSHEGAKAPRETKPS